MHVEYQVALNRSMAAPPEMRTMPDRLCSVTCCFGHCVIACPQLNARITEQQEDIQRLTDKLAEQDQKVCLCQLSYSS